MKKIIAKKLLVLVMLMGCLGIFGFSNSTKAQGSDWICEQNCQIRLNQCYSSCGNNPRNRACYRDCDYQDFLCRLECL